MWMQRECRGFIYISSELLFINFSMVNVDMGFMRRKYLQEGKIWSFWLEFLADVFLKMEWNTGPSFLLLESTYSRLLSLFLIPHIQQLSAFTIRSARSYLWITGILCLCFHCHWMYPRSVIEILCIALVPQYYNVMGEVYAYGNCMY